MVNIMPFAMCKSPTNPGVIAAMGAPVPCTPTCSIWLGGKHDVLTQGMPALLTGDRAVCPLGAGMIEVKDSGQGSSKTADAPMGFVARWGDSENNQQAASTTEIDGIPVVDGMVGGKIPVEEYRSIRKDSVKNPSAATMTLGKYTKGSDSYIAVAGQDSMYFDLGLKWNDVKDDYGLSDADMFHCFNKPALNDAINADKPIVFSHNPLEHPDSFLEMEWEYIKSVKNLNDNDLVEKGGVWYAG